MIRQAVHKPVALLLLFVLLISTLPSGVQAETGWTYSSDYARIAELKTAGLEKAREVEEDGIVLLKNDRHVLPLPPGSRVSLFGITAVDPVYGGTGSGEVETDSASDFCVSLTGAGLTVANPGLIDWYREQKAEENLGRSNYAIGEGKWSRVQKQLDEDVQGTAAIYVVGRVGGEGADMTNGFQKEDAAADGTDYLALNETEEDVLLGLSGLKSQGIIDSITVILNSANPLSAGFLLDPKYGIDAALWVGSLGQTGIDAVGRVLTGQVNPSGCLPDTWWIDNMANPVMHDFGAQVYENTEAFFPGRSYYEVTRYTVYREGIYLGYRYTETRFSDSARNLPGAGSFAYASTVAFPFGWGLSYTAFTLSGMEVRRTGEGRSAAYTVSVTVTNTGETPGKKTVQIYAQKPYTEYDRKNEIEKAAVELVGFAKTGLLQPGESQRVTVRVPEYYLTSYDALNTEVFVLDEGTYSLVCADNAHDAAERLLQASGNPVTSDPLVWSFSQSFDSETYALSFGTGAEVASLFAFADMNRYDGAGDNEITYYSRADWEGTVKDEPVSLSMTDLIALDLVLTDDSLDAFSDDSPEEFPVLGEDAGLKLIDLMSADRDDPLWDTFMNQLTFEELETLCGTGLRETAALPRIGKPYTLDHNGPTGVTQRYDCLPTGNGLAVRTHDPDAGLRGTCYPCNGILAATFNLDLIEEVGRLVGEDALWAGYAGIYGTGLNLHRTPYAGRVFEYFSEDSLLTGLMGAAWTKGVQSKGVYVYSKHLVLNEQEENRAGLGTWCNEQALRELYLRSFELPIVLSDARCVMSAFNRLGAVWCGASHELMTDWLRGEAGMKGFAVTDMYDGSYMIGANALAAGNDLPDGEWAKSGYSLKPYREDGDRANAAVVWAMRRSAKRILYTVLHSRGMDGISTN